MTTVIYPLPLTTTTLNLPSIILMTAYLATPTPRPEEQEEEQEVTRGEEREREGKGLVEFILLFPPLVVSGDRSLFISLTNSHSFSHPPHNSPIIVRITRTA
jgi:hypothetical protein